MSSNKMQDTQSSFLNTSGAFPNFVYKKKLLPLPLFQQNRVPKNFICRSPPPRDKTMFGFKTCTSGFNSPIRAEPPKMKSISIISSPKTGSPNRTFLNELKTVNNYGRLCDQPFIEFSNFHFQQVFGPGDGKRRVMVEPAQRRRENRKKISKVGTLDDSAIRSPIRIQDNVELAKASIADKKQEEKDSHSIIKKVYKIGEHEAIIGFYSLEIVMVPVGGDDEDKISLRLGRDDLKKVYKYPHSQIVNTISSSLIKKHGKITVNIQKDKSLKYNLYTEGETYPEKKDGLTTSIEGKEYNVTIYYPYLEINIKDFDYTEKMILRPSYLANLFSAKFDNLQDYIQKFNIPEQIYKNKEEIHIDNLKVVPPIIKKVLKNAEFGGLMLFKSIEIHLKNTSNIEPQTILADSKLTPNTKNILKKRKKDVNVVLLRVEMNDLNKLTRATPEEIQDLIQSSIVIEEGKGFVLNFDEHKLAILDDRKKIENDYLPEYSEKFTLRFNRFLYEGYIKYPTLELYVPETNFKDIIYLKPSQLQELLKEECKNMQDFLPLFKKPTNLAQHDESEVEPVVQETEKPEEQGSVTESPSEVKVFTFKSYSINISG